MVVGRHDAPPFAGASMLKRCCGCCAQIPDRSLGATAIQIDYAMRLACLGTDASSVADPLSMLV